MALRSRLLIALASGLCLFLLAAAPAQATLTTATTVLPGSLTSTTPTLRDQAQTQVDSLTTQAQAVQAEIAALSAQLNQRIDEYYACLSEMNAVNDRLSQLRRAVSDAQAKKARAQATLAKRIKAVYMSGGRDQLLQLLLLADGLNDLYNRMRLVSTLADRDSRIVNDLQNSSARLNLLLNAVDDERREELAVRNELSQRAAEIHATVSQKEKMLAGLDARVKLVIEQEHQRQLAEQARIRAEVQARLAAAADRRANILSARQIAVVAQRAGFTGHNLVIAVAVALAESGGNASAHGDVAIGGSFGLWQVFCKAHPDLIPPDDPDSVTWYDPYQNARWAYEISGGSYWRPWSTYKHGTYEAFMDEAQAAVVDLIGGF